MAYVTVEQMRDEGVTNPPYSDSDVENRIALAQRLIETILGCYYEKRTGVVFRLDGRGHSWIHLPMPPVSTASITSVKLIEDDKTETDYEAADYEVIMDAFPDGRFFARLRNCNGVWPKGTANIKVIGDFGFVDTVVVGEATSYVAPPEIQRLCKLIAHWGMPKVGDDGARRAGLIVEESLKDYRYRLNEAAMSGIFGDPEIDGLLALFYRPQMSAV